MTLKGRVALVTGASRGIGRSIAMQLAESGASVAICARSGPGLNSVERELLEFGVPHLSMVCDVRDEGSLAKLTGAVQDRLGVIDILVNNAGIYQTMPIRGHSLESFREVIDTNLTGAFLACRLVVEGMIASGWGRIVSISSISGQAGETYGGAYAASKSGLDGLTRSLALEVARFGITVNSVAPGWVDTDMSRSQLTSPDWLELHAIESAESVEIHRLSVPQMRFIEPDEVASLVTFLCSHAARAITGQTINICAGLSLL